jgi:hypothetical protein
MQVIAASGALVLLHDFKSCGFLRAEPIFSGAEALQN